MCSTDRCGGGAWCLFGWVFFSLVMLQPWCTESFLPFIKLLSVANCDSKYQSGGISNILICLFCIPKCWSLTNWRNWYSLNWTFESESYFYKMQLVCQIWSLIDEVHCSWSWYLVFVKDVISDCSLCIRCLFLLFTHLGVPVLLLIFVFTCIAALPCP